MIEDVIQLPPFPTPAKPRKGEACNGCGFCCHMEICLIGQTYFPDTPAPCPAIVYEDGKVRCGVVLWEAHHRKENPAYHPRFTEALGIGRGCDASDLE